MSAIPAAEPKSRQTGLGPISAVQHGRRMNGSYWAVCGLAAVRLSGEETRHHAGRVRWTWLALRKGGDVRPPPSLSPQGGGPPPGRSGKAAMGSPIGSLLYSTPKGYSVPTMPT